MLTTRRDARVLQEVRVIREDAIAESSSPKAKATKARRALDDVSNQKSQSNTALGGRIGTTFDKNEKPSLRRSQRLKNSSSTHTDPNSIGNLETKTAVTMVSSRNPVSKRGRQTSEPTKKPYSDDGNSISPDTKEVIASNIPLPSDTDQKLSRTITMDASETKFRTKKRTKEECFDIESALLEPRPRRKKHKSTTTASKKKKSHKTINSKEMKSCEMSTSKMQTSHEVISRSTADLKSTTHRCPDLLQPCDDDYCLPRKLEGPFDASKFTSGIATYDKVNEGKVGEVPAYVTDIFQRLFDAEEMTRPSPSYMTDEQFEINSTMRAILVDWLVGVQVKFRLHQETLYLCVNIIDRYLSRATIRRRRLQLLGITALFVACKYEEIYPLEVKDCVYVTDRSFNRQDVLDMEVEIVMTLGFKMTVPTAYPFLQRFLNITNAPKIIRDLASFYVERMLQEYCVLNFRASLVAATAVCLAWNNPTVRDEFEEAGIVYKLPKVLETIINYTGFCGDEIRHTASVMCAKIRSQPCGEKNGRPKMQLNKVVLKYRFEAYSNASCFDLPDVSHLDY